MTKDIKPENEEETGDVSHTATFKLLPDQVTALKAAVNGSDLGLMLFAKFDPVKDSVTLLGEEAANPRRRIENVIRYDHKNRFPMDLIGQVWIYDMDFFIALVAEGAISTEALKQSELRGGGKRLEISDIPVTFPCGKERHVTVALRPKDPPSADIQFETRQPNGSEIRYHVPLPRNRR